RENYPKFYWDEVSPLIQVALRYLRETQEGKRWIAVLYANVFEEEHHVISFGVERRR
ncbi:MAG TPA: metal-dependent phosphohydrolase, partial [Nitrospirales bacterium]|nr:metal-dependent phosphohydrolase [Nitrospirales bacterium]